MIANTMKAGAAAQPSGRPAYGLDTVDHPVRMTRALLRYVPPLTMNDWTVDTGHPLARSAGIADGIFMAPQFT